MREKKVEMSPNRIGPKEKRRAENLRDKLRPQIGQDFSEKVATERAVRSVKSEGGGNHGGEPKKKGTGLRHARRTGSRKN
jgi:hypothetical protein